MDNASERSGFDASKNNTFEIGKFNSNREVCCSFIFCTFYIILE